VVLAHRLAPASFGRISVMLVIVRFAALVGDSGAGYGGTRAIARLGMDAASIWSWQRRRETRSVALAAAIAAVAVVSGHAALAPMAVGVVARGADRDWMALGRNAVVRCAVPGILHGSVLVVGALLVGSLGAAGALIGAAAAVWWLASVAANRRPPDLTGPVDVPAVGHGQIALFADSLVQSLDVVLISALVGAGDAGIYAAMYRLPNALLLVIGLMVTGSVPRVVELAADPQLRRRCVQLGVVVGLGTVLVGGVLVASVTLLYGDAYERGRAVLAVLLLATTFTAISAPLRTLQLVRGSDRDVARATVALSGAVIVAYLVFIPPFGMMGAAVTTAVGQALYLAFFVMVTAPKRQELATAIT
jgi:O-antigen/teichoic acid export membrane protein